MSTEVVFILGVKIFYLATVLNHSLLLHSYVNFLVWICWDFGIFGVKLEVTSRMTKFNHCHVHQNRS